MPIKRIAKADIPHRSGHGGNISTAKLTSEEWSEVMSVISNGLKPYEAVEINCSHMKGKRPATSFGTQDQERNPSFARQVGSDDSSSRKQGVHRRSLNSKRRKQVKHDSTIEAGEVLYALGYIRRFIEDYSRSCTLSAPQLTGRLAALLLAQEGGTVLGPVDHMPSLRRAGTARNKTMGKMAVARRTRGKAQVKHWTQKPENRAKMRRTLKAMRIGREAKLAA